ncbi:MAG: hypothetical protein COU32_01230, partial [Candidatus Magasanikbacteria bacterium CG10_big_fil_rev_8_21_14_0_10_42_10]
KDFLSSFQHPPQMRKQKKSAKTFFLWVFIIFTVCGGVGTYYFYTKYDALQQNGNIVSQRDLEDTLTKVSALMVLPTDEVPTLATILDKTKLQAQSFFQTAENGDKLLAFTKSMQAILYRPSTNKIIKVAPIYIDTDTTAQSGATTQEETVAPVIVEEESPVSTTSLRIAYYNGSGIPNVSSQTEKKVQDVYPEYQTTLLANASAQDYSTTIVVDVSGQHAMEATTLAKLLGATVGLLPPGEVRPDADIVIISGK